MDGGERPFASSQAARSRHASRPRAVPLATPRLERLSSPRKHGRSGNGEGLPYHADRRFNTELQVLLRELHIADSQLRGREDAHRWQADVQRSQLGDVLAQMRTGAAAAMAAAASAVDARNTSAAEVGRLRDQITKLRAQVAALKADKQRYERAAFIGGDAESPAPFGEERRAQAVVSTPRESAADSLEAQHHEMVSHMARQAKGIASLEAKNTRLVNGLNSMRSERDILARELAASREGVSQHVAALDAARAELEEQKRLAVVSMESATDEHRCASHQLRSDLEAAHAAIANQRHLIRALSDGESEGAAGGAAGGCDAACERENGIGSHIMRAQPTAPDLEGVGGDAILETVRVLRQRLLDHERRESTLRVEHDGMTGSVAELKAQLSSANAAVVGLKAQVRELRQRQFAHEQAMASDAGHEPARLSGRPVESPTVSDGWDTKHGAGGEGEARMLGPPSYILEGDASLEEREKGWRELDISRRSIEVMRLQLRTAQAEHLKCQRELRALRSKMDSLHASCDAALGARYHAEQALDVQKVAVATMLQRLQVRSAECHALQRQLAARAVELVHARTQRHLAETAAEASIAVLVQEVQSLEHWIFGLGASGASHHEVGSLDSYRAASHLRGGSGSSLLSSASLYGGFGGAAGGGDERDRQRGGSRYSAPRPRSRAAPPSAIDESLLERAMASPGPGQGSQERLLARELMQCRHELEASRRSCAECIERTSAAERTKEHALQRMRDAQASYARLSEVHEQLSAEVQVQRNRVARLRLANRKERSPEPGSRHESWGHSEGAPSSRPLPIEARPTWDSDMVIRRDYSSYALNNRSALALATARMYAPEDSVPVEERPTAASIAAWREAAATSPNSVRRLLRQHAAEGSQEPGDESHEEHTPRELADLKGLRDQLRVAKAAKEEAERSAQEHVQACERLQATLHEADEVKGKHQASAAAATVEATTLRRQLQVAHLLLDDLREEKALHTDAHALMAETMRSEAKAQTRVLAVDLRELEALCHSSERYARANARAGSPFEAAPVQAPVPMLSAATGLSQRPTRR